MKVGSSPIYYIPGQEEKLEQFAKYHLKSKEKDAFILLQEKKILKDSEQDPAIRVALRSIKDFAIPIQKNNETYWEYYLHKEFEIPEEKNKEEVKIKTEVISENIKIHTEEKIEKQILTDTVASHKEKPKKEKMIKKTAKKKVTKKTSVGKKQDDKFFNVVKEHLLKEGIEISDIVGFSKTTLYLKVKKNSEEYLLVAYNQKKITEKEIIDANKKASELNLKYSILSPGEPLKKLTNLIEAIQNINEIKKID